ncbi:NUDIX hydrolase [Cellulomonas soli]|uniref:NUDIX hydrolase n=1 Tax=Cellulomonas soli TaxID=931535 RepID=A0A512PBI8_9CELL|nr:NUDIX hydrolase [Cellulomonas soli]NYI61036.1 8-oxo-dGTP pyrophosphatase MutT (NUDIX family) [Cellulomonas soli]GEP68548.1 NUDIX hydrolase [Cellulomonas soli]
MRWQTYGERTLYDSPWVSLSLVDVDVPGHGRLDHHVVRIPRGASGVVVHDLDRGLLLLWRHRFIVDRWGWEIPAGRIDEGESAEQAAAREVLEETGWRPGPLRPLLTYHPSPGAVDQTFHVFVADGATYVGPPSDPSEADRIEWVPLEEVRGFVRDGSLGDGMSVTGVLRFLLEHPERA